MKNKNTKKETYKKIGIGAAIVVVLAIIILLPQELRRAG